MVTMDDDIRQQILDIKKDLRACMNGIASAAMRQSDDYRVNFGVELPRLQSIASEYGTNHELAQELWKESVRECRILATMIQPVDSFYDEIADIWVDSIKTVEIAQIASMNLFCKLPYATDKAFCWIADEREIAQVCGYSTLNHIIRSAELSERSADELMDQACAVLNGDAESLKKIVLRTLSSYVGDSKSNSARVVDAMKRNGVEQVENGASYIDFVTL